MKYHVIVVSRHKSTVDLVKDVFRQRYLNKEVEFEVIEHIANIDEFIEKLKELVKQKETIVDVVGNLPLEFLFRIFKLKGEDKDARFKLNVYIVSAAVPRELRGQELTLEQLKQYVKIFAVYSLLAKQIFPFEERMFYGRA